MKKIFVQLFFCLPLSAYAWQTSFRVEGNTSPSLNGKKIYLAYKRDSKRILDSSTIHHNAFLFTGPFEKGDYIPCTLLLDHEEEGFSALAARRTQNDFLRCYLLEGVIGITVNDSVSKGSVRDALHENEHFSVLDSMYSPLQKKMNAWENDSSANGRQQYETIRQKLNRELKEFVDTHRSSLASVEAVNLFAGSFPDVDESTKLLSRINNRILEGAAAKRLSAFLLNYQSLSPGSMAPEFTQNDIHHQPVSLSSFRGKYVLLDFWAGWCGPCRLKNPYLVKIFDRFSAKGFTILGISLDREEKAWKEAIEKDKLPWIQLSDLKHWSNEVALRYGIKAIPFYILIDKQGRVVSKDPGLDELESILLKNLVP